MGGVEQAVQRRVDRRHRPAGAGAHSAYRATRSSSLGARYVRAAARRSRSRRRVGQARLGDRAEVAARALDGEDLDGLAGDRVVEGDLGRRVAAAVVGDPSVAPESVRPLDERRHPGCMCSKLSFSQLRTNRQRDARGGLGVVEDLPPARARTTDVGVGRQVGAAGHLHPDPVTGREQLPSGTDRPGRRTASTADPASTSPRACRRCGTGPVPSTTHSRTKTSVWATSLRRWSSALTGPATVRSSSRASLV